MQVRAAAGDACRRQRSLGTPSSGRAPNHRHSGCRTPRPTSATNRPPPLARSPGRPRGAQARTAPCTAPAAQPLGSQLAPCHPAGGPTPRGSAAPAPRGLPPTAHASPAGQGMRGGVAAGCIMCALKKACASTDRRSRQVAGHSRGSTAGGSAAQQARHPPGRRARRTPGAL